MSSASFDAAAHLALMEKTLGLTIEDDWVPGVIANLMAVARAADLVMGLPLGDHAEPAPVFEAGA